MRAILRTADNLDFVVEIPKFTHLIRRPICRELRPGKPRQLEVMAIRQYEFYGNVFKDMTPIYKEVYHATERDENG